ncbi:alpha/beta hydrolase [Thiopseudomonas denitrificans]|uniref:Alpha-beta hydrolase superfamily lysophospholipase n=1 Tax=Thiopseudomonas denitrificans TaxID=1501432 RepID=A0A4R6TUI6_9GAMM|nr:alpha/beta hydrolase [Thiopseudomonas denitrificans]TDQ36806.1 alpha-beta hydrolase superfamily lysophospholipase [Thiopseudomonas denitrificans]
MHDTSFWLPTLDATRIHVHHWQTDGPARASLLISHGMAEHGGRYQMLGQALANAGIAVYAPDLRGHGLTAGEGLHGHFADVDGWNLVIEDLRALNHYIRCENPHIPLFMLGHSLGSYLVMSYLMQYSCSVQGALLSGPQYLRTTLRYRLARLIARAECWRQGPRGRSKLLHALVFRPIQRSIQPQQSIHDWLSSDPAAVQQYLADPMCGFMCTNQLWLDVLDGLQRITPMQSMSQIHHQLPLFLFGGEQDPLHQGKRLLDLAYALRESGQRSVDVKLYPGMRHEPLNERHRARVFTDIIAWIRQQCDGLPAPHPDSPGSHLQ